MLRFWQGLAYGTGATGYTTLSQGSFKLKATAGADRHLFIPRTGRHFILNMTFGVLLIRLCVLVSVRLVDQVRA